jgi:hypothetical protein
MINSCDSKLRENCVLFHGIKFQSLHIIIMSPMTSMFPKEVYHFFINYYSHVHPSKPLLRPKANFKSEV